MRRLLLSAAAAGLLSAMLVSTAFAGGGAVGGGPAATTPAMRMLAATLTGAAEVPTRGPDTGAGWASIMISGTQVCSDISAQGMGGPATAAHIHRGDRTVAGPVVVPLPTPDAAGRSSGCASAEASLVAEMLANPGNFYVNVHTAQFPAGAVRGQLDARFWEVSLTPQAERPTPGDPNGRGMSFVVVDSASRTVCTGLMVTGIQANAAHIHRGGREEAGPVVVPLTTPNAAGMSDTCAVVEQALATDMLGNPANFYVNVHTAQFPAGAVRGQLR